MHKIDDLLELSRLSMENAHAIYSGFRVGAVVISRQGAYHGASIECVSYSLTMCAERNAIANALVSGVSPDDIQAIAIYAEAERPVSPCGACRQVMAEFMQPEAFVVMGCPHDHKVSSVASLLPYAFNSLL